VDFGEAQVVIAGEPVTAQLFCLRMGYSKQPFVTALPTQAQEAFFEGHVRAFDFLGGVPQVLVYDNLKVAVKRILEGRNREEQTAFIAFRSHYLFESRFCNPGKGHEKGLTEGLVGYSRRNWLVPPPEHASWDDLNAYLLEACRDEGKRRLRGMEQTIGEALALERDHLLPLPARAFPCCVLRPARANGFGLVTFQTNRYSVPAAHAHEKLWLRPLLTAWRSATAVRCWPSTLAAISVSRISSIPSTTCRSWNSGRKPGIRPSRYRSGGKSGPRSTSAI
jgi:hypothetical protein